MKDQKINVNVYSKKLNIDDLLALAGKEKPETGEKKAAAPAAPVKEPEPMDLTLSAQGEVKVDSAIYQGLNMSDFLLNFNLKNNKLFISKLAAKAGKGQFDLNSTVDFSRPGYSYKLSSKLDSLHADEVVNALAPKAKDTIFGILSFNLTLNGSGTLPENVKKNLIADGDFKVLDGKITDTGISEGLASFLNIRELKTINLSKADGTVKIKNSIARLDSVFESDDLAMDPKGNIGLDETLDLAFDLKMSPDFTKKAMGSGIAQYIKSDEGWGMIPLVVKGTLSKPKYTVDVAKASKRVIKKEADKFIDKLFNKKDSGSKQDGAAPTEDAGKQDGDTQKEPDPVKDLLKGLFK
jgi:AsmA protein